MISLNRRNFLARSAVAATASLCMPSIGRAAVRKFRIGHNNAPTSAFHATAIAFQGYLAEKSEGRLVADIFPSAQLGNDLQLNKAVAEGSLDMCLGGISILSTFVPSMALTEVPYLFKDLQSARAAFSGKLAEYIKSELRPTGIAIIGLGESGQRHMTANRPITSPADMKGLKLRVQPSKIQIEAFRGFGADAEALNFSDLPEAMRIGRFDSQENPISVIAANEFLQKLQTHLSLTAHTYSPMAISFSNDVLEDMPEADRKLVEAAGAAATAASRSFADNLVTTGLEKLKAAGMKIVTDVQVSAFQTEIAKLNDRFATVASLKDLELVRSLAA